MNIAQKIKRIRQSKEFSQDYMASKLGISQRAYGKMESGEIKIDVNKLQQIAQVLDIEAGELINTEEYQTNNFNNNKITNAVVNHFAEENNKFKNEILVVLKEQINTLKEQLKEKDKHIQSLQLIIKDSISH